MIDGGLVVGYLTAALVRGGQRWVDRTIDSLLDRLAKSVTRRLGDAPVERLKANPGDETVQREVSLTVDGALSANQAFAREIARLVAELDEKGGRELINQVYAQINVQAFDHGIAVGRDFNYFHSPDPSDLSGAPPCGGARPTRGVGDLLRATRGRESCTRDYVNQKAVHPAYRRRSPPRSR
jgi:hypothetical protein